MTRVIGVQMLFEIRAEVGDRVELGGLATAKALDDIVRVTKSLMIEHEAHSQKLRKRLAARAAL